MLRGIARPLAPDVAEPEATRFAKLALDQATLALSRLRSGEFAAQDSPPRFAISQQFEVQMLESVPLVPTICPIVVLEGSWRNMGRQYVQQVCDVYGAWIFDALAAWEPTSEEQSQIERWTEELYRYTPDIIDFAAGMADGCAQAGVPLSRLQSLRMWTGSEAPSATMLPMGPRGVASDDANNAYLSLQEPVDLPCSGACAWGTATVGEELIAGATTDHECTYQATIVARPENGVAFVYTPFSVTGHIPTIGQFYMAGHPGMNANGLAYVHHGGGAHMAEPQCAWGYGVRRGASTIHILAHARDAREALEMELAMPIGEASVVLGSVGGFWADKNYAYVLESRMALDGSKRPVLRSATQVRGQARPLLYANNNSLCEDTRNAYVNGSANAWAANQQDWFRFDPVQGWHAPAPADLPMSGDALQTLITFASRSSQERNRFAYRALAHGDGQIDREYMFALYRSGGADWSALPRQEIADRFLSGKVLRSSMAHRANAFTTVITPRADGEGIYSACIGPADRDLPPIGHASGYYYYGETAAFWHIRLSLDPLVTLQHALNTARTLGVRARQIVERTDSKFPSVGVWQDWIDEANASLNEARRLRLASSTLTPAMQARTLRHATRAQVRFSQVIDSAQPPRKLPLMVWSEVESGT
jgi:hypothetical protein